MPLNTSKSIIFPYTTLFRSRRRRGRWTGAPHLPHRGGRACLRRGRAEDRKSTRQNSSHVAISYAVFCLQKIKKGRIDNKVLFVGEGWFVHIVIMDVDTGNRV